MPAKEDIKHQEGCPAKRVVPTTRKFLGKGGWRETKGFRCTDCGERVGSKPKKVSD